MKNTRGVSGGRGPPKDSTYHGRCRLERRESRGWGPTDELSKNPHVKGTVPSEGSEGKLGVLWVYRNSMFYTYNIRHGDDDTVERDTASTRSIKSESLFSLVRGTNVLRFAWGTLYTLWEGSRQDRRRWDDRPGRTPITWGYRVILKESYPSTVRRKSYVWGYIYLLRDCQEEPSELSSLFFLTFCEREIRTSSE